MRSWKKWFVASFVLWAGSAVLLVTVLHGQETSSSSAKPQMEPRAAGVGSGRFLFEGRKRVTSRAAGVGTDVELGPMSPGMAPPWQSGQPMHVGPGMYPGGMMSGSMGSSPDPLAQEAFEAQQQVDQALARYQQTADEIERQAIKADLTAALERQFKSQQQRRMNELAEIESRVQKLRELIEKRNQAQQTIVSKRCDQLLSELDGLGWVSPEEGAQGMGLFGGDPGMPGMGSMPGGMGMPGGGSWMMPGQELPGLGSGMRSGKRAASGSGSGSSSMGPDEPSPPVKKEPRKTE